MKFVSMIIGHGRICYHCGSQIRMVLVPTISDRWQVCEYFADSPSQITLHDCPKHPSKSGAA